MEEWIGPRKRGGESWLGGMFCGSEEQSRSQGPDLWSCFRLKLAGPAPEKNRLLTHSQPSGPQSQAQLSSAEHCWAEGFLLGAGSL